MGVKTKSKVVEEELAIMPTAWESLMVFLNCQTQWRFALGMAGVMWGGLDYNAVKLVLEDMQASAHVFSDLRAMEGEALRILNEVD